MVKSPRLNSLLASTAAVLVLAVSSHAGVAQQANTPAEASIPMPDTTLPPPLTLKDIEKPAAQAAPAPIVKDEPKQTATTPAAEPAKPAPTTTAGGDVGDKLRDLIASKQFDRLVPRKADRAGIEAYYSGRNYAPLWVANNAINDRAKSAAAYLAQVDAVGLDPNDYPVPSFKSGGSPDALAEDELKLTLSALTFARHAEIGRIHFTRVGSDIQYDLVPPDPAAVLAKLADGNDAGKVLDGYNPPQQEFKALRDKLAELRKGTLDTGPKAEAKPDKPRVHVPDGKILRPGMKDARVVALRKRLDIAGDKDSALYDDAVRDAVKTFQTESELEVDGNLGPNTTRALNGEQKEVRRPSHNPIDTILVNMERWRWLPRELQEVPPVFISLPALRIHYGLPTPAGEFLPAAMRVLLGDGFPLQRPVLAGALTLLRFGSTDPYETGVDFALEGNPGFSLSGLIPGAPPPSALTRNAILVVDGALLARLLLADRPEWTSGRIQAAMAAHKPAFVRLHRRIPVLVVYATAVARENGQVFFYPDRWGEDRRLQTQLAGGYPYGER